MNFPRTVRRRSIMFGTHWPAWKLPRAGPFEAVAIIQPSSPFTLPTDIDASIELLELSGGIRLSPS